LDDPPSDDVGALSKYLRSALSSLLSARRSDHHEARPSKEEGLVRSDSEPLLSRYVFRGSPAGTIVATDHERTFPGEAVRGAPILS
jgi:hypothetical protein